MLEEKIEDLKIEVMNLTTAINKLVETIIAPSPETVEKAKNDLSESKKEKPKAKPKANVDPVVTVEELQELCTSIIRSDRSKRDQVKETIANFGGTNLKNIDKDKLPDLKKALEGLL